MDEPISEDDVLRGQSFCEEELGLKIWTTHANFGEICLGCLPLLDVPFREPGRKELHIPEICSPWKEQQIWTPLDLTVSEDVGDLPRSLECLQGLLGDASDLLADPGMALSDLLDDDVPKMG